MGPSGSGKPIYSQLQSRRCSLQGCMLQLLMCAKHNLYFASQLHVKQGYACTLWERQRPDFIWQLCWILLCK